MASELVTKEIMVKTLVTVERCQCDVCNRIEDAQPNDPAPAGWMTLRRFDGDKVGVWYICSVTCLHYWSA